MLKKYGRDTNSIVAVEKCVNRMKDKKGNISMDDFNVLEEQIKESLIRLDHSAEQIEAIARTKDINNLHNLSHLGVGGQGRHIPQSMKNQKLKLANHLIKQTNMDVQLPKIQHLHEIADEQQDRLALSRITSILPPKENQFKQTDRDAQKREYLQNVHLRDAPSKSALQNYHS